MRVLKLGAGLAVGYLLGTRAGREKYEQIVAGVRRMSGSSGNAETGQPATPSELTGAVVTAAPTEETNALTGEPRNPAKKSRPAPRKSATTSGPATSGPATSGTATGGTTSTSTTSGTAANGTPLS